VVAVVKVKGKKTYIAPQEATAAAAALYVTDRERAGASI